MWTLIFPHHEGRTPTHGYEATREAAMAAFAKSWRRDDAPALDAAGLFRAPFIGTQLATILLPN